jgi:hypothetical protein
MDPARLLPGPWPALAHARAVAGEFDPAGPLAWLVLLPALGAVVMLLAPGRLGRFLSRTAALWTLPGALFLVSAAGLGGVDTAPPGVRWLERLPGGEGLVLSPWNLAAALAVGLAAPVALLLPEPRAWEPARSGWLLALAAATQAALLSAGPGLAALGWLGGAWALFFLLGHQDAAGQGEAALAPFAAHAVATACVLAAGLAPPFLPLLVVAGLVRLGVPPFHGLLARQFEYLPTGAILLAGVAFVTTGLRALHDGLLALPLAAHAPFAVAACAAALWAGFVALAQEDLKRRLAGFLSTQAAVWAALLAAWADPATARGAVGGWAWIALVALAALVTGYARLWAFARTGDLRAYGGLGRVAPGRAALLVVATVAFGVAPLLGGAAVALARFAPGLGARTLPAVALAVGGALGFLSLALVVWRTLRGQAPAPLEQPELGVREVALLAALAFVVLSLSFPSTSGRLPGGLWPADGNVVAVERSVP